MLYPVIVFAHILILVSACPDPITTVHIQNHDGPIYVSPTDRLQCTNQKSNYGCNRAVCNQACDIQSPIIHNYPYHVCETDCKCLTKQLSTCIPINTVSQNTGTGYSYPYGYPEGYGSYGYSQGTNSACPIVSEGLIPLLKSYIGQSNCPKQCQCSQSYSSY